jgi:peptidylprolyl isomerase
LHHRNRPGREPGLGCRTWLLTLLLLGGWALSSAGAFAQDGLTWRSVDPANLVFIGMSEGEIVIELNPAFAPRTVARFKELVKEDFYRGLSFYRVIDGFVAQAGDESDLVGLDDDRRLPPEFERPVDREMPWTRVERGDLFAPETGFIDGFAAARDGDTVWLTHCPGVLAMARGNEPDSGGTDFYIVIGQAPRYLDRNLTIFGRVIDGMEVVQRIRRGEALENGIIENDAARSRIGRMRLAQDLTPEEQRSYYVMDTNSKGFRQLLDARRDRDEDFFVHKPPKVLDVCQVPVGSRFVQGRAPSG